MTPFPTLPGRELACPSGGLGRLRIAQVRNSLQDVEVASPSTSRRPQTTRFASQLFQFSRKIEWFGLVSLVNSMRCRAAERAAAAAGSGGRGSGSDVSAAMGLQA
jgi:hypothetical protein